MYKIAFIPSSSGSKADNLVKKGLVRELSKLGNHWYELVEYKGESYLEALQAHTDYCLKQRKVDLIITLGSKATQVAYEMTKHMVTPTPMIFVASPDPVALGLTNPCLPILKRHFTGVMFTQSTDLLPAQLLLKIKPGLKSILLVYRPDGQSGRTGYEADKIARYLTMHGIKAILHPITTKRINSAAITADLNEVDSATIIERSMPFAEMELIATIASKMNKIFWGDGSAAAKTGAVFGTKADFEYMGHETGKSCTQIARKNVHPHFIPTKKIENSRRLYVNREGAVAGGLALIDELVISAERAFRKQEELPTCSTMFILPQASCFENEVKTGLGRRMQVDDEVFFHFDAEQGWLRGTQIETDAQLHLLMQSKNMDAFVIFGDHEAQKAVAHMQRFNIKKPIVVISNPQQIPANDTWHLSALKQGISVTRVVLPPPTYTKQAALLMSQAPKVESINLLVGAATRSAIPDHLIAEIDATQELCKKRGVRFVLHCEDSQHYLNHFPREEIGRKTGWILCGQTLPTSMMRSFAQRCQERKAVCVSPSLIWARHFPLSVGIDANELGKQVLMPLMKGLLYEHVQPDNPTVILNRHDWYHTNINETLAQQLDIRIDPANKLTHGYGRVPVDFALDTAICMGQLTKEEQLELLRKKKQIKRAQAPTSLEEKASAERAES